MREVTALTATMSRVTLRGAELAELEVAEPAASVRLLVPDTSGALELPQWNGNEFLRADGSRARIRTLTPVVLRRGEAAAELDLDVVLHDDSPLGDWVRSASPGEPTAVSGVGSGYPVDPDATDYLLLGDESAAPAVATLLEALPAHVSVQVHLERREVAEQVPLPEHPGATVHWSVQPAGAAPGATLVDAAAAAPLEAGTRIWAAGEAAAVQRVRKLLFDERAVPRSHAVVRGYWKAGRAGT